MLWMVVRVAEDEVALIREGFGWDRADVLQISTLHSFPLRRIIMEEFIADEVESILYIAREISGMPHSLPHDEPVQERSSIQDPTFEGQRRSPCARVG
jgi:hypothetical protein